MHHRLAAIATDTPDHTPIIHIVDSEHAGHIH
jgi:hypothetical protein